MILVELTEYVGIAGTVGILLFIASLPVAYLYSWTAFRDQREWFIISVVASTGLSMIGFGLVWVVFLAMGKPKAMRPGSETGKDRN